MSEETAKEALVEAPKAPSEPQINPNALSVQQAAHFKFLLDKEREIQQAKQSIKAQEQKVSWAENLEKLKEENPIAVLDQLGMSTDDLIRRVSEGNTTNPVKRLEKQVSTLAQRLEEAQKREESERLNAVMNEAASSVISYVRSAKTPTGEDEYPLVKAAGAESLVFQRIRERYQRDGTMISEDEAAREVEKLYSQVFDKLATVKGYAKSEAPFAKPSSSVTLTNSQQTTPSPKKTVEQMTPQELLDEAVRAIKFDEV